MWQSYDCVTELAECIISGNRDREPQPLMEHNPDIHSNIPWWSGSRCVYGLDHTPPSPPISTCRLTRNGTDKGNLTIYTSHIEWPSISLMATAESLYNIRTKSSGFVLVTLRHLVEPRTIEFSVQLNIRNPVRYAVPARLGLASILETLSILIFHFKYAPRHH